MVLTPGQGQSPGFCVSARIALVAVGVIFLIFDIIKIAMPGKKAVQVKNAEVTQITEPTGAITDNMAGMINGQSQNVGYSENYFGLSLVYGNQVKYEGPVNYIEGPGEYIPDVIAGLRQQMNPLHVLLLPSSSLLIIVKSNGEHMGQKFNSPMSVDAAAGFVASVMKEGKRVKEISNLGAFEIEF